MVQYVDDICDELSAPEAAASLRSWAAAVLLTQATREFDPATSPTCVAAPDIRPPQPLADYGLWFAPKPVTFLHLNSVGRVDAVMLSWANLRVGLIVGLGLALPSQETFYQRQPAPDICVFSVES
jgi:hypothetical protein